MFGLFKDKKKELTKDIFGVFKPKIQVATKLGKWKTGLSFGDAFISDDYLLGFLNTYISFTCRELGYTGQDGGLIMLDVYGLLDKTYSDTEKQQQFLLTTQKARMEKRILEINRLLSSINGKLANENFINRAPESVIMKEKSNLNKLTDELEKVNSNLKILA